MNRRIDDLWGVVFLASALGVAIYAAMGVHRIIQCAAQHPAHIIKCLEAE